MRGLRLQPGLEQNGQVSSSPALATHLVLSSVTPTSTATPHPAATSKSFPPPAVPHPGCRLPSTPSCAQPLSLILPCSSISLCHPVHPSPGLVKKVSGSIELFFYTAEGKQKLTFIAPQISPGFVQFSDLIISL